MKPFLSDKNMSVPFGKMSLNAVAMRDIAVSMVVDCCADYSVVQCWG